MSLEALRNNLPSVDQVKQSVLSTTDKVTSAIMAPQIPKSHKAAMFKEKGGPLVVEEVETQQPQVGEVLVKVLATGVCHSDALVQAQVFGVPFPLIPGHEAIGDIVAVGPEEKRWKVGDRVGASWHGGHDGTCRWCQEGFNQACPNNAINGITRNGGYQEYCILRAEAVVNVPKAVDPAESGPLLCAGVTVFNSIRQMHVASGETVAIQGLGGLGHLALQYANKMGYRVVALSSSGSKEEFARKLGAHDYIDGSKGSQTEALQKLGGAALIVSTVSDPKHTGELLSGLQPKGKLVILAPSAEPVQISTSPMISGGLSVHSWPSGQMLDCEEAIKFAQLHDIKVMVEKFSLDEAPKAYEHMMSGKARFRSVIVM